MPIIKQGKSLGKFYMTTNDRYKKSDFVLVKSLVSFYGQVNKALRVFLQLQKHIIEIMLTKLYATSKCLYKKYERHHESNYLGLLILYAISHFADFEQVIIKIVILLGMPRQTASKLLYDDSYLIINKNEHAKYIITLFILKLIQ